MPNANSKPSSDRVTQLTEALIDGSINSAGFDELVQLLQDNPDARATYADYVNIHSALRQHYLTHSQVDADSLDFKIGDDLSLELATRPVTISKRWTSYIYPVVAATLLVCLGVLSFQYRQLERGLETPTNVLTPRIADVGPQPDPVESVAVLTRLVDVVWEDGVEKVGVDTPLHRQQLNIKSGLMQIEFYCGAAVIVEGPASFELVAPDRGFAHHGKLRAHVPARARGFTIGTKSGNVVDLGTEFGLDISPEGLSELHVIDGEVDFHDSTSETNQPQRLVGGQGIEVAGNGDSHRMIESDSSRFVNHAQLKARASQKRRGMYERWQDYHTQLRKDPAIVADYVFDDFQDWGRTLVNAAEGADETSYGAIVGAGWQRGRWPQSKALQFQSPSDRVRIKLDGEYESLTLAAWVQIEELTGNRSIALLHPEIDHQRSPDLEKQRFIHWTLVPTPEGAVLHFAESHGHRLSSRNHYNSVAHGVRTAELGTWVHMALVYDRENMMVSHYKNGELIGAKPIKNPRIMGIGVADIGNWPYKGWAANTQFEFRNLTGLMDEFVVLGRAMSGDEIYEMYEVGQP